LIRENVETGEVDTGECYSQISFEKTQPTPPPS
jgi:hypothetical protein